MLKRELAEMANCKTNQLPSLLFTEHHQSHAASAFFPSPFQKAAVLCLDGVGEWATTSVWLGDGNELTPQWEIDFPHSLGLLYSAFTYYAGFKVNSGEYKLMGLAPYGEPRRARPLPGPVGPPPRPRLRCQRGRVRAEGAGALWRAPLCAPNPGASGRSQAGRKFPSRPEL